MTKWISSIDLNNFGFVLVRLFVATWVCAVAYWRLSGIERWWRTDPAGAE